ncbi:MAG: chromate efflux transporter [Methylocystis sp.]|nr:chromate efflux transporter [Methylocystis sp.]MCA3583659.1 chromate efflux transporter [Methylocystis sp.]MCA3587859.1 chromate efflux transporter [Methylocystis sp.]MCA3593141.1 chromate efflux transporter [Methylocystis sp.]
MTIETQVENHDPSSSTKPSLGELTRAFFQIGVLSFGGATAQIAMMHQLAVDDRRWLDDARFLRALNLCMLLPGPEAQQLATYIGWRLHGIRGGLISGILFVLPGAVLMLGLSLLYSLGSGIGIIDGLFFGIKAAVLAVVAQAVIKLSKRALKTRAFVALAAAAFAAFAFLNVPFPVVIIAAAVAGILLARNDPASFTEVPANPLPAAARWRATGWAVAGGLAAWWLPVGIAALVLGGGHVVVQLALFFSKLAILSFGGAYALLAWLADEAVIKGWVTTREMIAGLGLAETTPGPTILVTQFVGFIGGWKEPGLLSPVASAITAATLTTWVTFAPSFLWIFAGAPWLDDLLRNRTLAGALQGITAAVVGAISWLALWFVLNTIFRHAGFAHFGAMRVPSVSLADLDPVALALALLALVLTFVLKRSMLQVIGVCALLGMLAKLGGLA